MKAPQPNPAERLREDFGFFLFSIWKHLGLPRPTPVQLDIASYLQGEGRRKVIEAFRGVGKSWITGAYVLWLLYRDPQVKVLVVSASKDRADDFSIFVKRLIGEVAFLRHLRPDPNKGDRDSNVAFDVRPSGAAHAPSCKSMGILGQITGSRADFVVCDDVEVPNNSESALQREKLVKRVAELGGAVLTPRAKSGEIGGVVFLGTPQVEDTLYAKLPDMGYDVRIWPAEVPKDPARYGERLAPMIAEMDAEPGTPTDPERFDEFELAERLQEYRRAGYSLQFMLDTSVADEDLYPLKLRDLIVFDTDLDTAPDRLAWGSGADEVIEGLPMVGLPGDRWHRPAFKTKEWSPYTASVMYIDPHGRGRDELGYAVIKELHGMLFVRQWGGMGGAGYDEAVLVKLATIARDEKVAKIVVEDNFGDGMWSQLFKPVLRRIYVTDKGQGCVVEDEKVHTQKERRIIDSLEPVMTAHRLIVDGDLVRRDCAAKDATSDPDAALRTCFHQLTRIRAERGCLKYDDRVDALAGAVRQFTLKMARDVERAADDEKHARLDRELEKIKNHWRGKKARPRSKTWGGRLMTTPR